MWSVSFLVLIAVLLWQSRTAGPRRALGVVVVLSLLVPSWVVLDVAGLPIHIKAAAGVAGLVAYCLHPRATINWRLGILDLLGLSLLAVHIASDWINDGFDWTVPLRAYGEWGVPYLAGRLALQTLADARGLMPYVAFVAIILASVSVTESVFRLNLAEFAVGNRPTEGANRDSARWGLKRAFGPTMHPIYFGALQVLLFPWVMFAGSRSSRFQGRTWYRMMPWLVAAGIILTMSRAPLIALGVLLLVTGAVTRPSLRIPIGILGTAALLFGIWYWPTVVDGLHWWGGETPRGTNKLPTVVLGSTEHPYSGTLNRFYLFDVYGLAMRRAGWLGFGTEPTTGFPVRVPVGPQHAETQEKIRWLDNAFILITLRFGYLGVALFALWGVSAMATLIMHAQRQMRCGSRNDGILFGAMGGAIAGTLVLLFAVWMPHDFGFWYLWCLGAASGLRDEDLPNPDPKDRVSTKNE
jgi:hypothetical protein